MNATVTINGQVIGSATEIEYTFDDHDDGMPDLSTAMVVEQTFTLKMTYHQLMWLAHMVQPNNPKKAKHIRNMADQHNPLRLLGFIK